MPFTEVSSGGLAVVEDPEEFVPLSESKRKSHGEISVFLPEKVRGALRRTRQQEIEQRLRTLRGELVEVSSKLSARGAMVPENGRRATTVQQQVAETGDESYSSRRLRHILNTKRRQIEHLEQQRQSPWALGLTDQSPREDESPLS